MSSSTAHNSALISGKETTRPARPSPRECVGYFKCQNCGGINTREEDDHGQPASCGRCGSVRIRYVLPLMELIEPEDLNDR